MLVDFRCVANVRSRKPENQLLVQLSCKNNCLPGLRIISFIGWKTFPHVFKWTIDLQLRFSFDTPTLQTTSLSKMEKWHRRVCPEQTGNATGLSITLEENLPDEIAENELEEVEETRNRSFFAKESQQIGKKSEKPLTVEMRIRLCWNSERISAPKKNGVRNGERTKDIALDVQIAGDLFASHKKKWNCCNRWWEKSMINWSFLLDADGIDLLQRFRWHRDFITNKEGNPSARVLNNMRGRTRADGWELLGNNSAKVNDPIRMYLKRSRVVPLLTNEEEAILVEQRWFEAKQRLAEAIFVWLFPLRKRYIRGDAILGFDQEGNMGLMKAVDKFDYIPKDSSSHLCDLVDSSERAI